MTTVHFITIFPNIWFTYFEISPIHNDSDIASISTTIKKFCIEHNIQKMIRCDKDINYWNQSGKYIHDIKSQMMNDEITMLTKYYQAKNNEIHDNYLKHVPTLIISHNQLEISMGLLILFMKKYGDQDINNSIKMVQQKLSVNSSSIMFSDSMIRLLQLAK
jgi:hypothetical protein